MLGMISNNYYLRDGFVTVANIQKGIWKQLGGRLDIRNDTLINIWKLDYMPSTPRYHCDLRKLDLEISNLLTIEPRLKSIVGMGWLNQLRFYPGLWCNLWQPWDLDSIQTKILHSQPCDFISLINQMEMEIRLLCIIITSVAFLPLLQLKQLWKPVENIVWRCQRKA